MKVAGKVAKSMRIGVSVAWLVPAAAVLADVTVVEYHHSGFDHYFVTPIANEIKRLDARSPPFELWSRTGRTFRAYERDGAPAGAVGICRFFNATFGSKSSHFYAPQGLGCEATLAGYKDWTMEDERLFSAMLPDPAGACPAGTSPLYRLYNNGQGGAPNHRFVTGMADRQSMLDKGYVAEGAGIGVGMCLPSGYSGPGTAEGMWRATTAEGVDLRAYILWDGRYFIVYSEASDPYDGGVLHGSSVSTNGKFATTSVSVRQLSPLAVPLGAGETPIAGTYFPKDSLDLSGGTMSVSARYDESYQQTPAPATMAGEYTLWTGHEGEQWLRDGVATADGHFTVNGKECVVDVAPISSRGTNVFDVSATVTSGVCWGRGNSLPGVMIFDPPTGKLVVFTPFNAGRDLYFVIARRR